MKGAWFQVGLTSNICPGGNFLFMGRARRFTSRLVSRQSKLHPAKRNSVGGFASTTLMPLPVGQGGDIVVLMIMAPLFNSTHHPRRVLQHVTTNTSTPPNTNTARSNQPKRPIDPFVPSKPNTRANVTHPSREGACDGHPSHAARPPTTSSVES